MDIIRRPGTRLLCCIDPVTGPIWNRLTRAAARGDFRQIKKQWRALEAAGKRQVAQ